MLIVILCRAYKNLSPRSRLGIGLGFIAWSFAGLYISDNAESKLGYKATEEDRARLKDSLPLKVSIVEREGK
jgi:hypothetical protein